MKKLRALLLLPVLLLSACGTSLLAESLGCVLLRICGGSGTTSGNSVALIPSKAVYVVSQSATAGLIQAYSINQTTGALTAIGSPLAAGLNPIDLVLSPDRKYVFVADYDGGILSFAIDPSTYALSGGTTVASPTTPIYPVVSSALNMLFIQSSGVGIVAYKIASGGLTLVNTAAAPKIGIVIGINPMLSYVYGAMSDGDLSAIGVFSINSSTGALTRQPALEPAVTGTDFPVSIVVHPNGKFLYGGDAPGYSINQQTGAVTLLTGTAFPSPNQLPNIDPTGQWMYVFDSSGGDSLRGFSINATTGALTEITGSPWLVPGGAGGSGTWISFDGTSRFLYATDTNLDLTRAYSINAKTGAISYIGALPSGGVGGNTEGLITY